MREILVVHAALVMADLLRRRSDCSWPQTPDNIEAGALTLASIGLATPLSALYRTIPLA